MIEMGEQHFSIIRDGLALIDYGPITMTLEASQKGQPLNEAVIAASRRVLDLFDQLIPYCDLVRKPVSQIGTLDSSLPSVVKRMIQSVNMLNERDFTPMAAVAGTFADLAVGEMRKSCADYCIANNGGDIAWYISEKARNCLRIGMISDINSGKTTHVLTVYQPTQVGGLATSGMGGRSLTRGAASAVTVLAADSSKADAAATAIANACFCDDPTIQQCPAEEMDYNTDIPGLLVTKSIGDLKVESIEKIIGNGEARARQLIMQGMIFGAVIVVAKHMRIVSFREKNNLFHVSKI